MMTKALKLEGKEPTMQRPKDSVARHRQTLDSIILRPTYLIPKGLAEVGKKFYSS
jgi:hypothetical protein